MEQDRHSFILEQLQAGKSKEEIRRELISHGFGSEGFDEALSAAEKEVGKTAPQAAAQPAATQPQVPPVNNTAHITAAGLPPLTGFSTLFNESFSLVWNNMRLYWQFVLGSLLIFSGTGVLTGVLVGAMIFLGIGSFFVSPEMSISGPSIALFGVLGIGLYILLMAAFLFVLGALIYSYIHRAKQVSYWQGLGWALHHIWPIFVIALLTQFVTFGGYVFLLIPGIALSIYLSYSLYVFASEDRPYMSALVRSFDLVYKKWWAVVGRSILFSICMMLMFLLLGIFSAVLISTVGEFVILVAILAPFVFCFLMLWFIAFNTLLFESLQSIKPASAYNPESHSTLRTALIVLAIIGFLLNVVSNGADLLLTDWDAVSSENQAADAEMEEFEAMLEEWITEQEALEARSEPTIEMDELVPESQ